MLFLLLILPPLAACILSMAVRRHSRALGWANVAGAALSLAASAALCVRIVTGSPATVAPDAVWNVDALSALLAVCITLVTLLAAALGPGLDDTDRWDPAAIRRFRIFLNALAFTMLVAVTTTNVAFMWVAIEATTITSAIIIPLERTKASVEASWKYLLICSVGIALAFAGTVLAYFDFVSTTGPLPSALNWDVLRAAAPSLRPELMRLAFAFILVGYGTKAGLAPMHTWLPDAHSEAPAPLSAMMSGVLLAVAMYAIVRWKAVVDASLGPAFTNTLLIWAGLLSLVIGTFSLVIQRHYKRMLAYSSVEHMGLVTIGLALGPLGTFAAFLHLVNHAVAKSMSFLLAGRILTRYRTSEVAGVSGLLRAMPWTGGLFGIGLLSLVGLPPFGLFLSEFLLVRAAVVTGRLWVAGAVLTLLFIAFTALLGHLNRMIYGPVPDGVTVGERRGWHVVSLAACAVALLVLGVALPWPVTEILNRTVSILAP
jgi:hydrogenase-4 component F